MSAFEMRPMYWMGGCITNQTCELKRMTRIPRALPIMCFGLMHLLGFRFAPRIRDLADKRWYVPGKPADCPDVAALVGGSINTKHIRSHWNEILRLAASIRQGTGTASLMLRKLS